MRPYLKETHEFLPAETREFVLNGIQIFENFSEAHKEKRNSLVKHLSSYRYARSAQKRKRNRNFSPATGVTARSPSSRVSAQGLGPRKAATYMPYEDLSD